MSRLTSYIRPLCVLELLEHCYPYSSILPKLSGVLPFHNSSSSRQRHCNTHWAPPSDPSSSEFLELCSCDVCFIDPLPQSRSKLALVF